MPENVLGDDLAPCSVNLQAGFYRTGACETGPGDAGAHVVCAQMTEAFLTFTKAQGNDLSTPRPAFDFSGLNSGDQWCLCATRWAEAKEAGVAPPAVLKATHERALEILRLEELKAHAAEAAG